MDLDGGFVRRALRAAAGAGIALSISAAAAASAEATIPTPPEALTEAFAQLDGAWEQAPLGFTRALFVEAPAKGYGLYTPRADATFSPNEPIIVYAEPVGFSRVRDGDQYQIAMQADFEIRTPNGQVLASQQDFAEIGTTAQSPLREFQVSLRFAFESLQAGTYVLMIRFKDDASGKSAELELPFAVAVAEASQPKQ